MRERTKNIKIFYTIENDHFDYLDRGCSFWIYLENTNFLWQFYTFTYSQDWGGFCYDRKTFSHHIYNPKY